MACERRRLPPETAAHAAARSLRPCTRGAVQVEYLLVVALMGLSLALTLVSLGPGVVRSWSFSRQALYGSAP
jgi:Flp pilus assembly pilin Flp